MKLTCSGDYWLALVQIPQKAVDRETIVALLVLSLRVLQLNNDLFFDWEIIFIIPYVPATIDGSKNP